MITLEYLNLSIGVAGLVVGILSLSLVLEAAHLDKRIKRYFLEIFLVLILYAAADLVGQFAEGVPGLSWLTRLGIFLESVFSSFLMLLLNALLLYSSGLEEWYHSRMFQGTIVIWLTYFALLLSTFISPMIYTVGADNVYHRGPLYPALLVPPLLIMGQTLGSLIYRWKMLTRREHIAFLVYCIVPMTTMVLQMLFYGVVIIVLGTAVSAMTLFLYIQKDQTEKYLAQERENAQLKTDILLAQIQPHFLYNSLGVIQGICETDSHAAALAIRDFTRFLGHNIDSISSANQIPFQAEWEHTQCYVNLQKLRFGDAVQVESDFQVTAFNMPTLTLQPIVENAITYGIRKNTGGKGTVYVRTREYEDRIEIQIEDNGPGFVKETNAGDGRKSHVGLSNVRSRLENVCGGSLNINSTSGVGTTVTIVLPKKENPNHADSSSR